MARLGLNPEWHNVYTVRNTQTGNLGDEYNTYLEAREVSNQIIANRYSDKMKFINIWVKKNRNGNTFQPTKIYDLSEADNTETFFVNNALTGRMFNCESKEEVEAYAKIFMDLAIENEDYNIVWRMYTTESFKGMIMWEPVTE